MTSDSSASHELIEQGQGLVRSLVTRVHRSIPVRADLDDLIAYGELGLAQAARDYDPSHGVAFTTFAFLRVRGAIYDGVAEMTWTSRAQYRRLRFICTSRRTPNDRKCFMMMGFVLSLYSMLLDMLFFGAAKRNCVR